jgi:hypothetical protein
MLDLPPLGDPAAPGAGGFVAILTLDDGSTAQSIVFTTYDMADRIGRYSLLDDDVIAYCVEERPGGFRFPTITRDSPTIKEWLG